jgi:hypothetical protein
VLALAHLRAVLQFCGTALLAAVPAGQRRVGGHGLSKLFSVTSAVRVLSFSLFFFPGSQFRRSDSLAAFRSKFRSVLSC